MLDFFLRPSVIFCSIFLLICLVYQWVSSESDLPSLPATGIRKEWFAKTKCRWRTTMNYREAVQFAYQNYSLKGLPCVLSTISGDVIVLPTRSMEWIINQPDDVLSAHDAHEDSLQGEYTFGDPAVVRHPHQEHIIKTDLLRQLGSLTMDIMDEVSTGFDEIWGLDTEGWSSISVYENMMALISRTTNRIFVGLPLCRNASYLSIAQKFSQDIVFTAFILRQLPRALRPILAPLITLPNKYHTRQSRRYLDPEIRSRLFNLDPEKARSHSQPNDFLQWSINDARTRLADTPEELSPRMLTNRLLAVSFAAIHTSTLAVVNAIFDLAASDPSLNYIEQIREEAASVLAEDNGIWTKRALSKMYKMDSALRESLRLRSFLSVGVVRKVVVKDGITTPEGVFLPRGASVAVSAYGIHNDESNYTNPAVYDALRYVTHRELVDAAEEGRNDAYIRKANCSMVSTSTTYQSFGHGRHACPGRFFASNELKLLLAYMVMNYEIEPLAQRPEGQWFATTILPPMTATIKVRRRKADVER